MVIQEGSTRREKAIVNNDGGNLVRPRLDQCSLIVAVFFLNCSNFWGFFIVFIFIPWRIIIFIKIRLPLIIIVLHTRNNGI